MGMLFGGLVGKLFGIVLLLGVLGGAYAYVTTGAYNRGVTATEKRMADAIAKMKRATLAKAEEIRALPPDKLDEALRKICLDHGGTVETCK